MTSVLLECKRKAVELTKPDNPPLQDNGRKKGYMCSMRELWEERGYEDLGLTAQNLPDQAARTEKSLGNVTRTMAGNVGTRNGGQIEQVVVESYLLEADCIRTRNLSRICISQKQLKAEQIALLCKEQKQMV